MADQRAMLDCGVCRQVTEHDRARGDRPGFLRCTEGKVGLPVHGRTINTDTETLPGQLITAPTPPALTSLVNRGANLPARPTLTPAEAVDQLAARRPYRRRTVAPLEETMPRPKKSANLFREAVRPVVQEVLSDLLNLAIEAKFRELLGLNTCAAAADKPAKRKYTRRAKAED